MFNYFFFDKINYSHKFGNLLFFNIRCDNKYYKILLRGQHNSTTKPKTKKQFKNFDCTYIMNIITGRQLCRDLGIMPQE